MKYIYIPDIKLKKAINDFSSVCEEDNINDSWTLKLEVDKNGLYKSSIKNIVTILENDENLKDKIAYNLFSNRTIIKGDELYLENRALIKKTVMCGKIVMIQILECI